MFVTTPTFLCGPYLLGPTTHSMTIAWECSAPVTAKVYLGTSANALSCIGEFYPDPKSPDFGGTPLNLYHCVAANLNPDSIYYYRVELTGGDCISASFRTLPKDPEQLTVLTISDSHAFATREAFHRACWKYHPHFILHTGDLVEGTGAQAEQFSLFLGAKFPNDYIHSFPVIYAEGNHDHGGPYFDAYIYDLQQPVYGGSVRGDSSIDIGPLHLITMNSGPWGLFQMNSESTGTPVDAETLNEIDTALQWLKDDLETDNAKNALFRMLMMHHPYSDAYTARYIPQIAEKGNVDLFLAGHTHSYARYVSESPVHAASTVYLTQQDARMYNARGDWGLMHFDFVSETISFESMGEADISKEASCSQKTVISSHKQVLDWSDVTIYPHSIQCGDTVSVSATITNHGNGIAAAVLPVSINGQLNHVYKFNDDHILLNAGESCHVSGELRVVHTGSVPVSLASHTQTIRASYRETTALCTNLVVRVGDGSASGRLDDHITVEATIQNIGSIAGILQVPFEIDGQTVSTTEITLESGACGTIVFAHHFDYAGEYGISVAGSDRETVVIEGSIQGMPLVLDRSECHNNAFIHGAPLLGKDAHQRGTLILDGLRDYLEIPDNPTLHIQNAVSGIVQAKFPVDPDGRPGLTRFTEPYLDGKGFVNDHNPMLTKGVCLGWGTSYQFRMVVRESGKVGYGICFEDDNGEFGWNDRSAPDTGIRQGEWMQIASTFDLESGGDSYENENLTAHVNPPPFNAPIKNWVGQPLRIGLGFKNKVHRNRLRGTYHTMLPGSISQVFWYDRKLTANEIFALQLPETVPSQDHLKLHLCFEETDFVTKGIYRTQSVDLLNESSIIQITSTIPEGTSIQLNVDFYCENELVESRVYPLEDGTQSIELLTCNAPSVVLQFTFQSFLSNTRTAVPVLHDVALKQDSSSTIWSTLASWNQGTYEGAVAHQDSDVYRNHASDLNPL